MVYNYCSGKKTERNDIFSSKQSKSASINFSRKGDISMNEVYESPTVEVFEGVELSEIKSAGGENTNCMKGTECGSGMECVTGHICGNGSSCGDGASEDVGEKVKEKLKESFKRAKELLKETNESEDKPEIE